ncbi:MAG: hypothetical protein Q9226_009112, partial [Calogaya cf. arnoldii]
RLIVNGRDPEQIGTNCGPTSQVSDARAAEISKDEFVCAKPDPQLSNPRLGLSVITACFAGGQTKAGVDLGPSAILNDDFNILSRLSKTWQIEKTS